VAGVLGGHNVSIIKPGGYGYDRSIDILVFVVLGGMGNIRGSIIAAFILTLLPEVLRPIKDYRMLMYAVVLIAMMIFNHSNLKIRMQESNSISKLFGKAKFGK
jgi:branched-chain amino acid transport system permease protein